jgi:hypothetical protein
MDRLIELQEAGYKVRLDNHESQWCLSVVKGYGDASYFRSDDIDTVVSDGANYILKESKVCEHREYTHVVEHGMLRQIDNLFCPECGVEIE